MTRGIRLGALAAGLLALAVVLPREAGADPVAEFYRGKTVRMLIGAAAGGGYDAVGRAVARHMGRHIPGNPSVVVENMPGAASLIMTNHLYNRAPRDGTVMGNPTNSLAVDSKLKLMAAGNVMFDTRRMSWIGTPARQPQVLFVWHDTPFHTLEDMKKDKLILGAIAAGADNVTLPMIMNQVFGTRTEAVVGYKGTAEILIAMERREVQGHVALLANVTAGSPHWLKDRKIRIVLQFGSERSEELRDVPTALELATSPADQELLRFYSLKYDMAYPIVLPPDVPAERIKALRQAFDATMSDPQYREDAKRVGLSVNPLSGDQVASLIAQIEDAPEAIVERIRKIVAAGSK